MCLGIPGQIVEISDITRMRAKVDAAGKLCEVSLSLIGLEGPDGAGVGDWVLVHLGFAMAKIDAAEAMKTLDGLTALGDMYEQALTNRSPDIEERQGDHAAAGRQS